MNRALDVAGASVALALASPALVLAALAVKLEDGGPVLYRQSRVGRDGVDFELLKLRTMVVGAESRGAGWAVNEGDPRITRVGRLLRRISLDELPQLWNVVIGDMSLIGPRPALPHQVASYDESARRRLAVKPGLTGLWQVSGRSNLSWDESVRLDSDYVDNWRPGRDVSIALRTVKAVLTKDGAV